LEEEATHYHHHHLGNGSNRMLFVAPTGPGIHRSVVPKAGHALTFKLDHSSGADHQFSGVTSLILIVHQLKAEYPQRVEITFATGGANVRFVSKAAVFSQSAGQTLE
jgi:hypothetical protein